MDILTAIREGRAHVEWADLVSEHNGNKLTMRVFRDAMKVDGIRRPVNAREMQQVADLTFCMMPTPKILDLIWVEAGKTGIRFDPVINHGGKIVANLTPEIVSPLVDIEVEKFLDKPGKLIASVGKYWVLSNRLAQWQSMAFGRSNACNYGWHSSKGLYQGVTPGLKVWQSMGYRHNDSHVDPSQVIRLVSRLAMLTRSGSTTPEEVDLHTIAADASLAPLINHTGVLTYLRQMAVPEPQPVQGVDGVLVMPELVLF